MDIHQDDQEPKATGKIIFREVWGIGKERTREPIRKLIQTGQAPLYLAVVGDRHTATIS